LRVFILFFFSLLFAQNYVDIYRYNGSGELIKKIEKALQSKEYWLKRLKNKNIKLGYFEGKHYILFCNKKEKKMDVFEYNKGKLKLLKTYEKLIVGKLGDKQKEGDLKTPIGVYSLIRKIKPSNTFYGPLAFVTSYPNLFDKVNKKNGYGIWIHGKPLDGERGDMSKGCIVLNNDEIIELSKLINYKNTTLEITQNPIIAYKKDLASILAMLYKWRDAWRKSDLNKYISFYDKDFKRSNGMNLKEFKSYKKRIFQNKKGKKVEIYFKNIEIVPYQNIQNLPIYRIKFHEDYISPTYQFHGNKEIFVINRDGEFKILIEK
jgi:murein L,D-transpeptidase YafK